MGGEGNANITIRGIPVASGGAKFLQIHEDGLPLMQFGDVAFGNADIFVRADQTISRIEAIRGGSSSTIASNSPAGIINFISKNGKTEGGSLMQSFGVDFDNHRTDFEYGSPIGNGLFFHVGCFYRQGEGPRNAGYTANVGGEIKANITKEFEKGFVRLYLKHLNDWAIGYLPMPVRVSGTNSNPNWSSLLNFDILSDTQYSALFLDNLTVSGLSADMVNQAEIGYKGKGSNHTFYATGFYALTSEQNWDFAPTGIRQIQREYTPYGLELEGSYTLSKFNFNGSVAWTKPWFEFSERIWPNRPVAIDIIKRYLATDPLVKNQWRWLLPIICCNEIGRLYYWFFSCHGGTPSV